MIEVLEDDFRHVVGISWYLWIFVVIFFLLNVKGWYTYFWIAFIPFLILLAVGTMLEHVLIHLVHEVANQSIDLQSVDHFWFIQPKFILILIHFILFQNSFEIAFFFWMWLKTSYSVDACAMGEPSYIVIRLVTGAIIQFLCSYNTLPVYALVTQMGEHHYNRAIFDELQRRLVENPPQERPH
ncbi:hypothetical protein K1719_022904 [Acacia pycnantha]|nr:hypothetical protein K1719_022904 [Acacia pycnantha]